MLVQWRTRPPAALRVPAGLFLGFLSPTQLKTQSAMGASAVATASSTPEQVTIVREELRIALRLAFEETTYTAAQANDMLDFCVEYRPVFALSPEELGHCTIFEAALPLKPGTRPVDRPRRITCCRW